MNLCFWRKEPTAILEEEVVEPTNPPKRREKKDPNISEPVTSIIQAIYDRPKTFKGTSKSYSLEDYSGRIAEESLEDTVTGIKYFSKRLYKIKGYPKGGSIEYKVPFPITGHEMGAIRAAFTKVNEERKERLFQLKRDRITRLYK